MLRVLSSFVSASTLLKTPSCQQAPRINRELDRSLSISIPSAHQDYGRYVSDSGGHRKGSHS
jgi:hypothetical protein